MSGVFFLPAEIMVVDLKSRLGDLPPELYEIIKSFVFTTDTTAVEWPATQSLAPCTHTPAHLAKPMTVTRIDKSWRPPHWMQVDRASRKKFSAQLFNPSTNFIFPSIPIMKRWIESLPHADILALVGMKIFCVHLLSAPLTMPNFSVLPSGISVHESLLRFAVEAIDRQAMRLGQVVETVDMLRWLKGVQGGADGEGFKTMQFVQGEKNIFKEARCGPSE